MVTKGQEMMFNLCYIKLFTEVINKQQMHKYNDNKFN